MAMALNGKAPARLPAGSSLPTGPSGEELKQQALAALIDKANVRQDRGDSTQMMTDILNRVDLGRHGRIGSMWDQYAGGLQSGGDQWLSGVQGAFKAQQALAARGSGGGGGAPAMAPVQKDDFWSAYEKWLKEQMAPHGGGGGRPMQVR